MTLEQIMKQWTEEAVGTRHPEYYVVAHVDADINVITNIPGLLIGYHGQMIDKYRQLLSENGYTAPIKIIDISSNRVRVF